MTVDEAEAIRERTDARSLDGDELGQTEELVRDIRAHMQRAAPKQVITSTSLRGLFVKANKIWPRLRATTVIGASVDFTLIPRALQAEEDLIRCLDEFKSIHTAQSLGSSLHL